MSKYLKTQLRDLLPKGHQVPAKYWYCWATHRLEPEMHLLELIVNKGDLVIDVGGNRGIYTYFLWRLGAHVEVFEPNSTCQDVLFAWANNKFGVNIHTVALSNREGYSNLHIPIDESGVEHDASASIENGDFGKARNQLVPLRTLDSFGFENVAMMKIDVEGHEYEVIDGSTNTLMTSRPALLVEIEERHISKPIVEVFKKILDIGYQGYFLDNDGLRPIENFDVLHHQSIHNFDNPGRRYINNFLFLHLARLACGDYGAMKIWPAQR